jgi:hypothetical protein
MLYVIALELLLDAGRKGDARRLEMCIEQRDETVRF